MPNNDKETLNEQKVKMEEKLKEGWQAEKHYNQRVYHYIDTYGFSLCGNLGFYFGELMKWTGNPKGREDCSRCYKLAEKRHK